MATIYENPFLNSEREFRPTYRLTTDEVCSIARISTATMWRRIRSGHLPRPVDRGRQALFDTDSVYRALGL